MSVKKIKMKKKPIEMFDTSQITSQLIDHKISLDRLYVPQKTKETTFIDGSPEEIATKLTDLMINDIKVFYGKRWKFLYSFRKITGLSIEIH